MSLTHQPPNTISLSHSENQDLEERLRLLKSNPADNMDRDLDLLQRMTGLNSRQEAFKNAQSMLEAYLDMDDRFFTKETIMRKGLFLMGRKGQSALRRLQNPSYPALEIAMGTDCDAVSVV